MIDAPIVIEIPGPPVPQGRPRMAVIAGHAMAYKPANSRRWEHDARLVALKSVAGMKPLTGCLRLAVRFHLEPPKSWPAWKIEAALTGKIRPSGKPDLTNLVKAAEDALNGVVWADDAQVVLLEAEKLYSDTPRTQVLVWEIEAKTVNAERQGLRA